VTLLDWSRKFHLPNCSASMELLALFQSASDTQQELYFGMKMFQFVGKPYL